MTTVATFGHRRLLGLFAVLTVTQIGHVGEHVAQMVQIHVLHLPAAESRGIVGALDVEWVHFLWNSWILIAVVILARGFRRNRWLWITLTIAGWHELEHVVVFSTYLATGVAGTPGLLAADGHLGGGLPVARPDLHFLYNLVETLPLIAGFLFQLARSNDAMPAAVDPETDNAEYPRGGQTPRQLRRPPAAAESHHASRVVGASCLGTRAGDANNGRAVSVGQPWGLTLRPRGKAVGNALGWLREQGLIETGGPRSGT